MIWILFGSLIPAFLFYRMAGNMWMTVVYYVAVVIFARIVVGGDSRDD